jgi:hypothetical protein
MFVKRGDDCDYLECKAAIDRPALIIARQSNASKHLVSETVRYSVKLSSTVWFRADGARFSYRSSGLSIRHKHPSGTRNK